jgi:hypothetical protein
MSIKTTIMISRNHNMGYDFSTRPPAGELARRAELTGVIFSLVFVAGISTLWVKWVDMDGLFGYNTYDRGVEQR